MSDYWNGLVNYKQKEKKYRYFRAEVNSDGEAKEGTIVEVNFIEERDNIKEQIQEDIITYLDPKTDELMIDDLCQIVVDNFKGFE
jgi:hypothetical protein